MTSTRLPRLQQRFSRVRVLTIASCSLHADCYKETCCRRESSMVSPKYVSWQVPDQSEDEDEVFVDEYSEDEEEEDSVPPPAVVKHLLLLLLFSGDATSPATIKAI